MHAFGTIILRACSVVSRSECLLSAKDKQGCWMLAAPTRTQYSLFHPCNPRLLVPGLTFDANQEPADQRKKGRKLKRVVVVRPSVPRDRRKVDVVVCCVIGGKMAIAGRRRKAG
jgi:hypothetical protein